MRTKPTTDPEKIDSNSILRRESRYTKANAEKTKPTDACPETKEQFFLQAFENEKGGT